jgi:hypothetical protein
MRTPRSSKPASPAISAGPTTFGVAPPLHGGQSTSADTPFALRLRVFLTRGRLDAQIGAAHPLQSSAALALRARQLTDPGTRQQIARNLRGIVDYAYRRSSGPVISPVVIEPTAVRTGRSVILGLAERLEGTAPVTPRGVVLARALLTDGRSPLFNPHSEQTVSEAVWEVADALQGPSTIEFEALAA